jgi:hypothetical protein
MFDISTSTKLNVILGLLSALLIFLIVLLCRKGGEGYKVSEVDEKRQARQAAREEERQAARQAAREKERRQLAREEALTRRSEEARKL